MSAGFVRCLAVKFIQQNIRDCLERHKKQNRKSRTAYHPENNREMHGQYSQIGQKHQLAEIWFSERV